MSTSVPSLMSPAAKTPWPWRSDCRTAMCSLAYVRLGRGSPSTQPAPRHVSAWLRKYWYCHPLVAVAGCSTWFLSSLRALSWVSVLLLWQLSACVAMGYLLSGHTVLGFCVCNVRRRHALWHVVALVIAPDGLVLLVGHGGGDLLEAVL
ncbi:hypothetical protein F5883DRAFT_551554 [Diaporthe sp. PMI_573]|nr:hypothetical protein F5883DRAFT_551554 [Diaporthaceae sp. PMI_573]